MGAYVASEIATGRIVAPWAIVTSNVSGRYGEFIRAYVARNVQYVEVVYSDETIPRRFYAKNFGLMVTEDAR